MELIEKLGNIAIRLESQAGAIGTEEATKMAFVMPFLQALGYDVFNPSEVVPEYTADAGIKKAEKVDYAIKQDGEVIMLIECKSLGKKLSNTHTNQLFRYFSVMPGVKLAILTNGQHYQFYTDMEAKNLMDPAPFMELDLLNIDEHVVSTLLPKLTKGEFNPDAVIGTATTLKTSNAIKEIFERQLQAPEDDFIKFFAAQIHTGPITQHVRDKYGPLIMTALQQYIKSRITKSFSVALAQEEGELSTAEEVENAPVDSGIVTTEEEIEAFNIVRAIARQVVELDRIVMKDAKSYCNVLLDNNVRKPIVRFHFNSKSKSISIFRLADGDRAEDKFSIESIDDIFEHADLIKCGISSYDAPKTDDSEPEEATE